MIDSDRQAVVIALDMCREAKRMRRRQDARTAYKQAVLAASAGRDTTAQRLAALMELAEARCG